MEISLSKEQLKEEYLDLLIKNPLLARIEGAGRTAGWTDEQIRTYQLIIAVRSNASLQDRLTKV